jgi:hypothetical protein
LVKDGSFESVPASALDTYFTDGGTWGVSGAVKFEAGADGFSTPYGSTYVQFYGGQSRTAPVAQAGTGPYDTSKCYTFKMAARIVKNSITDDPDFGRYTLSADLDFNTFWSQTFTLADGTQDSWSTVTANWNPG